MGMDYAGRVKDKGFSLNWAGVGFMHDLLAQLGADLSQWSGANEGDEVAEATCQAWGRLLRENIDRISLLKIPEVHHEGGFMTAPLVEGHSIEDPLTHGATGFRFRLANLPAAVTHGIELVDGKPRDIPRVALPRQEDLDSVEVPPPDRIKVEPLPDKLREWILRFADFLETCGGCRQY